MGGHGCSLHGNINQLFPTSCPKKKKRKKERKKVSSHRNGINQQHPTSLIQFSCGFISRKDRNIRLNINSPGMEVITEPGRRLALDLGIVQLNILQIRRAGARLGQEQRVRVISVDIRRTCSITRALQLKRGEQTADNRQIGTDQTNSRLDVRPQSGLVDGESRVRGVDPEEHDDAVDTCEANECAEGEDPVQRELVLPCAVEIPDHWDGEEEDDEVHEYVEGLVDDDEFLRIETCSFDAVVPVCA